jgi:methionyl-tRNA synthetase
MRNFDEEVKWGRLAPGTKVFKGDALFPRIDMEIVNEQTAPKDSVASAAPESTQEKAPVAPPENVVTIDEFARVQLKTGKIIEAERVPKSNKLLRLQVDTGEMRQVVAGIAKWYAPEDIIGKTVVIVCNLAPAKLMGVESQGMILAASDAAGNLAVISPERPIAPGNRVK